MLRPIKKFFRNLHALLRPAREREQLSYLLSSASAKASLSERVIWLEDLMFWVRTSSPHAHSFNPETGQLHNVRIRFLIHLLERQPEWKVKVAATLRSLVKDTSARSLFSEVGLGQYKGLVAEMWDVFFSRWLPRPAQERDLSELFVRIFDSDDDAIWVRHIPSALVGQVVDLIRENSSPQENVFAGWHRDIQSSLLILAARASAMGTLPEVMSRVGEAELENYCFLRLNYHLVQLIERTKEGGLDPVLTQACLREIEQCRKSIKQIYAALEQSGVSVSLVYTLENLSRSVNRIELLLTLMRPPSDSTPALLIEFLAELVRERLSQSTLCNLVRTNLHLISTKIVERAGATGEHYISRTRAEYFEMWRAGLGGGVIMVGTTLMKFFLGGLGLPMLFQGVFFSLNYAGSFVVLQLSGFTLATKQPSATASALAGKLRDLEEDGEVREFVNEVCRMTRTQFAALLGNLSLLIPTAILLDLGLYLIAHKHFLSEEHAHHVLGSLDPIHSLTIPMAALTGVWLWLSSLAAGWLENWVVFRRMPEALASQRRLIQVFGKEGARKIGEWTLHNATLLGGNISLGLLMGFTAVFGSFTGLPLDVRHVTLSSASVIFGISSLFGHGLTWQLIVFPCLGVLIVGALNFAVGYSLAFAVAVRAREVDLTALRRLFRAVRVRFRNRPRDFFIPPPEHGEVAEPYPA